MQFEQNTNDRKGWKMEVGNARQRLTSRYLNVNQKSGPRITRLVTRSPVFCLYETCTRLFSDYLWSLFFGALAPLTTLTGRSLPLEPAERLPQLHADLLHGALGRSCRRA
jgi:hypothetical protein